MQKEKVVDYLYDIFNSKKNGVQEEGINKMISKAVTMLSELYGVDVSEIEKSLKLGQQIEQEHTKVDVQFQKIIALQHLAEKLDYYTGSKPKDWAEKELSTEKSERLNEVREMFGRLLRDEKFIFGNLDEEKGSKLNENKQFYKLLSGDLNTLKMDEQYAHAELSFEQLEDGEMAIYLSEIWSAVRGNGYATKLLNKIKNICLKMDVPLCLRASTTNNIKTNGGGLNQNDLVKWYEKNGFRVAEKYNNFETDSTAPFMIFNY